MSQSFEKQETSETVEVDSEDVLHRDREKEKLESGTWTSAILKDIELYKDYEFRERMLRRSEDERYKTFRAYKADDSPENVFTELKKEDSEVFATENWSDDTFHRDGVIKYDGRTYEYKENLTPVAVLSRSPDTNYTKKVEISKDGTSPLDVYDSLSDKTGHRVAVGTTITGKTLLSRDVGEKEDERVSITKRTKTVVGGGVVGILISAFLSILLASISIIPYILTAAFLLGTFGSVMVKLLNSHDRYTGIDDKKVHKIPSESLVRRMKVHGSTFDQFTAEETTVRFYDDGSIVFEYDGSKWTFESNIDGTPNQEAVDLLDNWSDISNKKEFAIAENNRSIDPVGIETYESDDSDYVLARKSEVESRR